VLRRNGYLYDASIEPVTLHDGVVDLVVRTRDVWTLNPGINYSRSGGENDTGAQIEEKNLLGTGQQVRLAWGHDVDRETIQFDYHNPHLFDGFTHLGVTYADASDGVTQALSLVRPFYSLDTPWSAGLSYFDGEREDPRYVLGEEVGDFRHREERYEIQGGTSRGHEGRWVRRWTAGFTYENDEFEQLPDVVPGGPLPENRKLAYPWIGFEIVEDSYEKRLNQDQIRRTEDVLVGLRAGGRLGFASEALGSDRDAMVLQAWLQDGHNLNHRSSMFASLAASGRLESGDLANGILEGELRYYLTTSQRTKFFAALSGTATHDLDLENQLLLGGDNGLRGYPLRYQAGTSRALLTLEERYYTSWYPFRLFHVASAVFFDMGRTWGTDVTGAESAGWLRDVGIGLRFGSSRSAFGNVIHVDLAFPLDGDPSIDSVQFLVETKARF
jgi:outer membrane protein assembly factor BamA